MIRPTKIRPTEIGQIEASSNVIPAKSVVPSARTTTSAIASALTRLPEKGQGRSLLLRELVHLLHEDFSAVPVIVFHQNSGREFLPIAYLGCDEKEATALSCLVANDEKRGNQGKLFSLFADTDEQLMLYIGKHSQELTDTLLNLLIRELRTRLERDRWFPRKVAAASSPVALPSHLLLPGMVYRDEAIRKIVEQIYSLRSSDIPILITGETGTGKDLIARAVHTLSSRAKHSFIPFNCAVTPRELIESQLFGHRSGAFTGAKTDFPGLIGAAEQGTLFLDEVGELAREVQPKLLRFLHDGEIQRLGETKPRRANVRVIAATNRNLKAMVDTGDFRIDLYYRLNVVQFYLPPLRERREEIPLLSEHFLQKFTTLARKQNITLTSEVMDLLYRCNWPGNARELENEIQRLVALAASGSSITPEALSPSIIDPNHLQSVSSQNAFTKKTLAEIRDQTEREMINESLARYHGNLSRAAVDLGISRNGLRKMIVRLQLDRNGAVDAH